MGMAVLLRSRPRADVRAGGGSRVAPMPRALAVVLVGQGVVLAVAGVALFLQGMASHGMAHGASPAFPASPASPASHGAMGGHGAMSGHLAMSAHAATTTSPDSLWPWTLGPLASGVIAAWLLAFAVAVVLCVVDGDLARLRIATTAYTAFGVLQLGNVLRFRDDVAWSSPAAWVFVLMGVAVTATGATGWVLGRRGMRTVAGRRGAASRGRCLVPPTALERPSRPRTGARETRHANAA
jgi:hypothetical protein